MDQVPDIFKKIQRWKYVLHIFMENQESSLFSGSGILFHDHLKYYYSELKLRGWKSPAYMKE